MKYIKQYEKVQTNKGLLDSLNYFLSKALPDNFIIKIYSGTINITDTSSTDKKAKAIGYYYTSIWKNEISINLSCRTSVKSNIVTVQQYIISKIRNLPIIDIRHKYESDSNYDYQDVIILNLDQYDDVIDFFYTLDHKDLLMFMASKKYNI